MPLRRRQVELVFRKWSTPLRTWQQECYEKWLDFNQKDWLIQATPGSGKTTAALRIVYHELSEGLSTLVVVVCHTEHLCKQWADAAHRVGIDLDPRHVRGKGRHPEYHGMVITYQSLMGSTNYYARLCRSQSTVVVLDEIHHAAEKREWGLKLQEAFGHVRKRVNLSGTPFRTDDDRIQFLTYQDKGDGTFEAVNDFEYSYERALREHVNRYVAFPYYDGNMKWMTPGGRYEASMTDEISLCRSRERLRTALMPDGELLAKMLQDAHRRLLSIRRNGHRDAGGLVIAMSQEHARAVAKILEKITGYQPALVISDELDACDRLAEFARSSEMWLVTVKMASEGVDIPRLRVGVYATDVVTELAFRQAIGRIARMIGGIPDETAYMFMPQDPCFVNFAEKIKEERRHAVESLEEELKEIEYSGSGRGDRNGSQRPPSFLPIEASNPVAVGEIFDGNDITSEELAAVEEAAVRYGISPAKLVGILLDYGLEIPKGSASATPDGPTVAEGKPKHEVLDGMRRRIQKLVGKLAKRVYGTHDKCKRIHQEWIDRGGMCAENATLEDLRAKQEWILDCLEKGKIV